MANRFWMHDKVCFSTRASNARRCKVRAQEVCDFSTRPVPIPGGPVKFGCQYDDGYYSSPRSEYMTRSILLTEMMGPEGLQFFLHLIDVYELPAAEVHEMIRRVHVPGYEHARLHFEEAKETGVVDNHDPTLLTQNAIESILGHVSRFDECGLCPPSRP